MEWQDTNVLSIETFIYFSHECELKSPVILCYNELNIYHGKTARPWEDMNFFAIQRTDRRKDRIINKVI